VRLKNESFIYHASLTLQWTPLLLEVSTFTCENTHSVALGLHPLRFHYRIIRMDFLIRLMGTVTSNETATIS